jgi:hypothetical protein
MTHTPLRRFSALVLAGLFALTACTGSSKRLKTGKTLGGEVVEAEGLVPYRADDLPGTKAAVLAAAQRSAVELVVGVYVTAKTRVEKAVAIEQNILTRTAGYVKRYEILSEGRSGDWYKMRIRALVATGELRDDLDNLGALKQPAVGFPRVAVQLHEYIGQKETGAGAATQAITQVLLNAGYKVVEVPFNVRKDDDAIDAAKQINHATAEIYIAGFARAQPLEYDQKTLGGLVSYRATVNFRLIETGTGEVVGTISQTASGLDATPELAAQKAFQQAAALAQPELTALPTQLAQKAHVDMTLTGLKSFEILAKFQKSLTAEPGVKDLFLRSYSQETGVASLDILVDQVSPQELAERAAKKGGVEWSVLQVSGRSVQLATSLAGR